LVIDRSWKRRSTSFATMMCLPSASWTVLRSTQHLLEIAAWVQKKGAHLHVLNLGMDTSTATGKLLLTIIGAIGQFEREMMLERQREGIAKAKAEGKYKGQADRTSEG
jgi:DNA invertase Pin-like site-specific DNA recombinase